MYYRVLNNKIVIRFRIENHSKTVVFKSFEHKNINEEMRAFRHEFLEAGFTIIDENIKEKEEERKNKKLKEIYESKKNEWKSSTHKYFCIVCENALKTPHELKQGFHDVCYLKL